MAGVATTVPDPILDGFQAILFILGLQQGTTPHTKLERIVMLPLREIPPVLVYLETLETQIIMLWASNLSPCPW